VTYPDGTTKQYLSKNTSFVNALTGIIDENGSRFATYTYDTQGRAISSQHAGGAELTNITYNGDGTSTVTDANGNTHSYGFTTQFGVVKPTVLSGAPVQAVGGTAFTYDANGFVASPSDTHRESRLLDRQHRPGRGIPTSLATGSMSIPSPLRCVLARTALTSAARLPCRFS